MSVYANAVKFKKQQADNRAAFMSGLRVAQNHCAHSRILHWTGAGISLDFPVRVCLECGLEEVGSWWSYAGPQNGSETWTVKGFGSDPVLAMKHGRTIEVTDKFDHFQKHRLNL